MQPEEVKQLVSQTVLTQMSSFGMARVPFHIHNGADSPYIAPQQHIPLMYFGTTLSSGAPGTIFPSGWSSTSPTAGEVIVTHNLGTINYVVMALQDYPGSSTSDFISVERFTTSFNFIFHSGVTYASAFVLFLNRPNVQP